MDTNRIVNFEQGSQSDLGQSSKSQLSDNEQTTLPTSDSSSSLSRSNQRSIERWLAGAHRERS